MKPRRKTRKIKVGSVEIGGDSPISVQTMTKNPTTDINKVLEEIKEIEEVGADIVRISVPDEDSAKALFRIREKVSIPIVADIHFDWKMAIKVLEDKSADCVRINPGNIINPQLPQSVDNLFKIVELAKMNEVAIRVGVNAGSLEKDILSKYGKPTPEALCESALRYQKIIENWEFYNMKFSLKSSSPLDTIKAYLLFSELSDYPLHVGVTEAGTRLSGAVRSAVAIGILLWEGVGDTIRVSLSAPAVDEVIVGKRILASLGLYQEEGKVISCPTCARVEIDVINLAEDIEKELLRRRSKVSVAIMGCVVNGPGESYMTDVGVFGAKGGSTIISEGKIKIKKFVKDNKEIKEKILEAVEEFSNKVK